MRHHLTFWEKMMSQSGEIAARLTVLETVVRQLITHMAVRDENPAGWVQTRKTLAISAITAATPRQAAHLHGATQAFFDQAEVVARNYGAAGKTGTTRASLR
jgi:hypothetical protein